MKGRCISILSILVLLLASCETVTPKDLSSPFRFYADPTHAGFFDPAVAVGKDGMKYFAWSECQVDDRANCDIVVTWTKAGETHDPMIVERPAGSYDRYPDITVTDDGLVYLVWERQANSYSDCWAKFDPNSPGPVSCRVLGGSYNTYLRGPKIASYGDTVYAVYGVMEPRQDYVTLRYRQLNPLDHSGGSIDTYASAWVIAVSSVDTLHVAWITAYCIDYPEPVGCGYGFNYGNNRLSTGNIDSSLSLGTNTFFSEPVIGVARLDNNRVYLALWDGNKLKSYSIPDDGSGTPVQGKDYISAGGNWSNPSMAINEANGTSNVSIAFSEIKPGSQTGEIYIKDLYGDPVAQTDNDVDDVDPQVVFLKEKPGSIVNFQVLVWWVRDSQWNNIEVYEKTAADPPRVIYDGPGKYGFLDLAANGPWVAGVWDTSNKYLSKQGLMAAFNVHRIELPLVLK